MVEVKGWRNGLLVTLPDTLELDELLAAIRERLEHDALAQYTAQAYAQAFGNYAKASGALKLPITAP